MIESLDKPEVKELDLFWEQYEVLTAREDKTSPAWLRALRKTGLAYYAERGFPTIQDEEWKFTNLESLAKLDFKPALEPGPRALKLAVIKPFLLAAANQRLVFVDGLYREDLSAFTPEKSNLTLVNLAAALLEHEEEISQHLGKYAVLGDNVFSALNAAFFQDGAWVKIPADTEVSYPIHLLFITTNPEPGASTHPHNVIIAGKNSRATIIESFVNLGGTHYFTNPVSELVIGENANLEHIKVQEEGQHAFHIGVVQAHQARNSRWVSHSLSLGARLARNNIQSVLAAEGGDCLLNGLYLAGGEQLVDHHTVIDHAQPHCTSHEFYHGILAGEAKGVFNGKIFVRKDAQKTDAKQTNRNLLLSDAATINTKPQLEIFADDVKCTHGATVGQLDEEAVFYLCSRGIGQEEARGMLIHAFARQIPARIRLPALAEELDQRVLARLNELMAVTAPQGVNYGERPI